MLFCGLQKTTLLDYPEHVAATVFLGGCNFRCPYCFEKGVGRDKMVFTPEMVDKAFEAIFYIEPNEKYFFKNICIIEKQLSSTFLLCFIIN